MTARKESDPTNRSYTMRLVFRVIGDRLAVIELIAATTTKTGLKVECALDPKTYHKGIKVSDAEMKRVDIRGDTFHPECNYSIMPHTSQS